MSALSRLFRPRPDPRGQLRPLWHRVVEVSRAERWYRQGGVADSVPGRFDMIATILALVLLRLEAADAPPEHGVHLTELFVADMDRQLRESGVGDLVVGKKIGRLVAALGGRLGALRDAFAPTADPALLEDAVRRNVTLNDGAEATPLADLLRQYHAALATYSPDTILAAELPQ
ncbi:ubiquinol-cytochrome C chaperone family protein [Croceibacterium sp. TMG7-5b_MA50]|uniref:ubiquinol-cytochrome C chaperone family protein n=1 Tax=Croceibacterium sp. TMG7-5b_MA50 TaxID=3121290 RepID=UPI0032214153